MFEVSFMQGEVTREICEWTADQDNAFVNLEMG